MTVITGVVKNVAGSLANGFVSVKTKKERGVTGTFIDTREHRIKVEDGELIDPPEGPVEVVPGPVTVTVSITSSGGSSSSWDQFDAVVPEAATVDLWDLKEQTYTYEPPVISQVQSYKTAAEEAADRAEAVEAVQNSAIAGVVTTGATKTALDATYAPVFPTTGITYTGGNVATVTENGVTTSYTYNPDGTVATDTRAGVTRTYTYDGSGNLTGIAS